MAIRQLYGSSFAGDTVTFEVTFDDVSLLLQQVQYSNTTDRPGAVVLTGPLTRTIPAPANTTTNIDLTSTGVTVVKTTGVNKFGPFTAFNLPGGEQLSFQWPS